MMLGPLGALLLLAFVVAAAFMSVPVFESLIRGVSCFVANKRVRCFLPLIVNLAVVLLVVVAGYFIWLLFLGYVTEYAMFGVFGSILCSPIAQSLILKLLRKRTSLISFPGNASVETIL